MVRWCCQKPKGKPARGPTASVPAAPPPTPVPEPSGAVIVVSSTAELLAAIAACVGGETIKCGPATYAGVGTIEGKVFTTPITITRTGVGGAILTNFNMADCGGFVFSGLQMYVDAETYGAFRCERCSRITFSGCEIHGDPASFDDPARHFNGMNVLFVDGHVEFLTAAQGQALTAVAQSAAGKKVTWNGKAAAVASTRPSGG